MSRLHHGGEKESSLRERDADALVRDRNAVDIQQALIHIRATPLGLVSAWGLDVDVVGLDVPTHLEMRILAQVTMGGLELRKEFQKGR